MTFGQKLKSLMQERTLTTKQVCDLCEISPQSLSQYLNGHNEPSSARMTRMGEALGVDFAGMDPTQTFDPETTLTVDQVAKLMGKSREFVMTGLQDGVFPWGYAVKMGRWSYWISRVKFEEMTGVMVK